MGGLGPRAIHFPLRMSTIHLSQVEINPGDQIDQLASAHI